MRTFDAIRQRANEVVAKPAADGHFYGAEAQAIHDRVTLLATIDRLMTLKHPECLTCREIAVYDGGFGPNHDASRRCESGGYNHCTCDTCF